MQPQVKPQDLIDAIVAQRDAALASAAMNAALLAAANRKIKELQEKLPASSGFMSSFVEPEQRN